MNEREISIPGLAEIDVMQLEEQLPEGVVSTRPPAQPSSPGEHGDFGLTTAIVIISVAAINGLAIWLAKRRGRTSDTTDITLEKGQDGYVLHYRTTHENSTSEPPDAASIESVRTKLTELVSLMTPGTPSG